MKTKIWRWMLIVTLFSLIIASTTTAIASAFPSYRFKYEDATMTKITGYTGTLPEVLEIPATVTEIGDRAFAGSKIKSLVVPARVETIGNSAFSDSSLERVQIARAKSIGKESFSNCKELISVSLGNNLQTIGKAAFSNCVSLVQISLPTGLQVIDYAAFLNCKSLESIDIPDSVVQLGSTGWGWSESEAGRMDGVFDGSGLKSVTIGNGIPFLGPCMFANCRSLETVTLGTGVKSIYTAAFYNTSALKGIILPSNIEYIGCEAFSRSGIQTISFPDNIRVNSTAFFECSDLQYIYMPASYEEVSDYVYSFAGANLKRILYGGSAIEWDQQPFSRLEDLGVEVVFNASRPVPVAPSITSQPSNVTALSGSSTRFTITATVKNAFTGQAGSIAYQWQIATGDTEETTWQNIPADDINYAGATTDELDVLSIVPSMDGNMYRCIVINVEDPTKTSVSNVATLTLTASPTPTPNATQRPTSSPSAVPTSSSAPSNSNEFPTLIPNRGLFKFKTYNGQEVLLAGTLNPEITPYDVDSVEQFFTSPQGSSLTIEDATGNANLDPLRLLATGDQLILANANGSEKRYPIVVQGDVLGTGRMTLAQVVRIAQAYSGTNPLVGVYAMAADWTESGSITLSDVIQEARMYTRCLGLNTDNEAT